MRIDNAFPPARMRMAARSLVQRHNSPVAGSYSCSCHPSPNPYTTWPAGCASNCSSATRSESARNHQRRIVPLPRQRLGRQIEDPQEEARTDFRFRDDAAVQRETKASAVGTAGQQPSAKHQRERLRRPTNPSLAPAGRRPLPARDRHAGGLGRQRPALAEIPGRRIERVPVHFVRPHAADELAETERPPVRRARRAVVDEREVAAQPGR